MTLTEIGVLVLWVVGEGAAVRTLGRLKQGGAIARRSRLRQVGFIIAGMAIPVYVFMLPPAVDVELFAGAVGLITVGALIFLILGEDKTRR